jgi:GMP synthase-like glutamine amidotransferase
VTTVAPKVLFLVNDHVSTAGLLGEVFAESGFDIQTFEVVPAARADRPAMDVCFPDPTAYDVIIPLGARWHVYDRALIDTWVGAEMSMLRAADAAGVPVLGVCFGGQLVAAAHGGSVAPSTAPEIGWSEITTDEPALVPAGTWFQWHVDRWTLPPGAREIARTDRASQAFRLRRNLAVQFHPELDLTLLRLWIDDDRDGEVASLGVSADDLLARTGQLQQDAEHRVRLLVGGFLQNLR